MNLGLVERKKKNRPPPKNPKKPLKASVASPAHLYWKKLAAANIKQFLDQVTQTQSLNISKGFLNTHKSIQNSSAKSQLIFSFEIPQFDSIQDFLSEFSYNIKQNCQQILLPPDTYSEFLKLWGFKSQTSFAISNNSDLYSFCMLNSTGDTRSLNIQPQNYFNPKF